MWPKSGGPRYGIALGASAGFSVATAVLAWDAKDMMVRRSKKLRESEDESQNLYVY